MQVTDQYEDPHHYAVGIPHVLVNGVPVIKNGEHTDAKPGQCLRHAAPDIAGHD
jgi:N-acyl-D-amino-acid deacylase